MIKFRWLFLVAALLIPTPIIAQEVPDSNTVTMPKVEFDQMILDIELMLREDSLQKSLINEQATQITRFESLMLTDSLLLSYKTTHIGLLEEEVELYQQRLENAIRKHWYDSRTLWFSAGAGTVLVASWVLKNVLGER